MIRKAVRIFNSLILNNIKLIIIKLFHFSSFKFHFFNYISPFLNIDIQGKGKITFGKKCNILSHNFIGVRDTGLLNINSGIFINRNCQIIAHEKITIGENTCIGPNTVILDHNHKIGINGFEKKKFETAPIIIGKNVWIGANVVILKGVTIGDNSVIAAGSVITKNVPSNVTVIQKKVSTIVDVNKNENNV